MIRVSIDWMFIRITNMWGGRRGCDRMVVGFTILLKVTFKHHKPNQICEI